jgi:CheY-like chemotaxis protein
VSRRRLLVLDDDPGILSLLRSYFHGLGWEVVTCAEARDGLRLLDSDVPFDAVICDLHFTPARAAEGFEILTRARRHRPAAAVVLFTAAREETVREEAFRLGADEVISKPSPLARLRDAMLRAVNKP